jgi:hypothetical protein
MSQWLHAQKVTLLKRDAQDSMETTGAAMAAVMNLNVIQVLNSILAPTLIMQQWTGAMIAAESLKTSVLKNLSDKN